MLIKLNLECNELSIKIYCKKIVNKFFLKVMSLFNRFMMGLFPWTKIIFLRIKAIVLNMDCDQDF